jgi:hypothetical protein
MLPTFGKPIIFQLARACKDLQIKQVLNRLGAAAGFTDICYTINSFRVGVGMESCNELVLFCGIIQHNLAGTQDEHMVPGR